MSFPLRDNIYKNEKHGVSAIGARPRPRHLVASRISSRGQRLIEAKVHLLLRAALRLVVLFEVPAGVVHDAVPARSAQAGRGAWGEAGGCQPCQARGWPQGRSGVASEGPREPRRGSVRDGAALSAPAARAWPRSRAAPWPCPPTQRRACRGRGRSPGRNKGVGRAVSDPTPFLLAHPLAAAPPPIARARARAALTLGTSTPAMGSYVATSTSATPAAAPHSLAKSLYLRGHRGLFRRLGNGRGRHLRRRCVRRRVRRRTL